MRLEKIIKTKEYKRISSQSKKLHAMSFLILYNYLEQEEDCIKLGITVSKRVGKAVVRNKCKRRIRAIINEVVKEKQYKPLEMVIIAKPAFATLAFPKLKQTLEEAFLDIVR